VRTPNMKRLQTAVMTAFSLVVAAACGEGAPVDPLPSDVLNETGSVEQHASVTAGDNLFKNEMFWGNNRTCATCHSIATGTVNPQQIVNRGWGDPIIRKLDSDNPSSSNETYDLLRTHATINVTLTLPSNIRLANSSARTVTVRRGVPTTNDMPAFDTMIMFDGREASLQSQARSAVLSHYQAGRLPTTDEQNSIALFEKTLFSSTALRNYAAGTGPMPGIPAGNTDAEKRGAAWFAATGLCGSCHGGALLNRMTAGNPMGLPAGTQFGTALVSERNKLNNPVLTYLVRNSAGVEESITTADPGLMLKTGNIGDANLFKMLSLRNLKNTAPYFHDNSAKTIDDIMDQYNFLMNTLGIPHTSQDIADLTAYLKLL
jgi:cytochrome c peroxidase